MKEGKPDRIEKLLQRAEEAAEFWRSYCPDEWAEKVEFVRSLFVPYTENGELKMFVPAKSDVGELRLFIVCCQHISDSIAEVERRTGRKRLRPKLLAKELVYLLLDKKPPTEEEFRSRVLLCFLALSLVDHKIFQEWFPAALVEVLREKTTNGSASEI